MMCVRVCPYTHAGTAIATVAMMCAVRVRLNHHMLEWDGPLCATCCTCSYWKKKDLVAARNCFDSAIAQVSVSRRRSFLSLRILCDCTCYLPLSLTFLCPATVFRMCSISLPFFCVCDLPSLSFSFSLSPISL